MTKPVPVPNADSKPFWDGCAEGEIRYQHCPNCGNNQFYPRALCIRCCRQPLEWRTSDGKGEVYSFTQVHIGLAAFKDNAPYDVVMVEMTEGFRMLMNISGDREGLAIGRRGHIVFEDREGISLPQFALDPA